MAQTRRRGYSRRTQASQDSRAKGVSSQIHVSPQHSARRIGKRITINSASRTIQSYTFSREAMGGVTPLVERKRGSIASRASSTSLRRRLTAQSPATRACQQAGTPRRVKSLSHRLAPTKLTASCIKARRNRAIGGLASVRRANAGVRPQRYNLRKRRAPGPVGKKKKTIEQLDAELDKHMGDEARKARLEAALDAYFITGFG